MTGMESFQPLSPSPEWRRGSHLSANHQSHMPVSSFHICRPISAANASLMSQSVGILCISANRPRPPGADAILSVSHYSRRFCICWLLKVSPLTSIKAADRSTLGRFQSQRLRLQRPRRMPMVKSQTPLRNGSRFRHEPP
jgi:hypothetical protein